MNKKEILKTIHDLLSVRKGNKGYNDVWNKGYELHQLIETKQLNLTDVVGQSKQLKPKEQICYKSNEPCKYDCSGLCKESC
jgi:hypothetical protein